MCKRADVPHFGFHAIRHHVTSYLRDREKVSIKDLQEILGHKSERAVEIYSHNLTQNQRATMALLEQAEKEEGYENAYGRAN